MYWSNLISRKVYFYYALVVTLIIMLFSIHSPAYASGTATVVSTLPASEQQQVDPESVIKVKFDGAMNSATLTSANIILKDSTQQSVCLLSIYYDSMNNTAVITPAAPFKLSTDYQGIITTGVQDSNNNPLAQEYSWSFRTAAILTYPTSGQSQVDPKSAIFVMFDQAMNPSTFTPATCSIKEASTQQIVSLLSIHYDATNHTVVLIPATPLKLSTDYQAIVTTGVQYSNNTSLAQDYTWSFRTADSPQSLAPAVVLTTPLPNDSTVGLSKPIQVSFNRGMDGTTINNATILLKDSAGELVAAQSITYDSLTRRATFIPTSLLPNQTYLVTLATNIKDSIGEPLAQEFKWSFTTGTTAYFNPHGNYISNSTGCKSCHQTHTAYGKGLLNKSAQTQVCYTCHDGSGSATNLKDMMNQTGETQSYHPIRDTGNPSITGTLQCTDCHNPHGDKDEQGNYYPNLLRSSNGTTIAYKGAEFCSTCHNSNTAYKLAVHGTNVDCSSCHTSHSSIHSSLNVQPGNNLCFQCHTPSQYGVPGGQNTTISGFSNNSLVNPISNLHVFNSENMGHLVSCSSCHVSHGGLGKGLLVGTGNPITAIDSQATTGEWIHSSCTTSCHTPEPDPIPIVEPAAEPELAPTPVPETSPEEITDPIPEPT